MPSTGGQDSSSYMARPAIKTFCRCPTRSVRRSLAICGGVDHGVPTGGVLARGGPDRAAGPRRGVRDGASCLPQGRDHGGGSASPSPHAGLRFGGRRGGSSRDRSVASSPRAHFHGHLCPGGDRRSAGAGAALACRRVLMSALRRHGIDYLAMRRSLGFKLTFPGQVLPAFADYLDAAGVSTVTTEVAIAWASLPQGTHRRSPPSARHRRSRRAVRMRFAGRPGCSRSVNSRRVRADRSPLRFHGRPRDRRRHQRRGRRRSGHRGG